MLLRLLNWVPVLFGLKFAGVASVATVSDVVAGEPSPQMTTSEVTDREKASEKSAANRVTSGTAVTRLMTSSAVVPATADTSHLTESFVFADTVANEADVDIAPDTPRKTFVARPISSKAPRPTDRLKAVRAARIGAVVKHSGQVKQSNRPKTRAELNVQGKKATKRIAWIAKRSAAASTAQNVIPFPVPTPSAGGALSRAA